MPDSTDASATSGADVAERTWTDGQELSLRLWIALARCYSTYAKAIAGHIQDNGLTTPQFGILEALYHLGPLSLGTLASKLLVTGGNVTYVMDRLEDRGLVERVRSGEDRRVVEAQLTAEGRKLVSDVFPDHVEFIERITRHLDEDEQLEMRRLLKKLGKGVAEEDLGD